MAKKKQLMEYLKEFVECSELQGRCMLNGDYKLGNKAYAKTEKILQIAKNDEQKEDFYTTILNSTDDANTLIKCCAHMFRLGINPKTAREKLQDIASDSQIHPLLKSDARLFLQEWDKGNIKPVN